MKRLIVLLLVISFVPAIANATDKKENVKEKSFVNQTHCPVMGGEIDSTVYTDIQGQRVYHCCPMCSGKLKADPDKFFKQAAENKIVYENIQKVCPVSQKELQDDMRELYFEGRRLYFCTDHCIKEFKKEPQKYLNEMTLKHKEKK